MVRYFASELLIYGVFYLAERQEVLNDLLALGRIEMAAYRVAATIYCR